MLNYRNTTEPSAPDFAAGLTSVPFLLSALRRRLRLWLGIALGGLLLGVALFAVAPPVYQATTRLMITHAPGEDPVAAMQTDQAMAQSKVVADRVRARLQLPVSTAYFMTTYNVDVVTNEILQITVRARSADAAVRQAQALAFQFLPFRVSQLKQEQRLILAGLRLHLAAAQLELEHTKDSLVQARKQHLSTKKLELLQKTQFNLVLGLEVEIQDYPVKTVGEITGTKVLDPAAIVQHSRFRYLVVYALSGLIVGLAGGIGLVFVLALSSDGLRRRDDVARALGAPVGLSLGRVRAGRRRARAALAGRPGPELQRLVSYLDRAAARPADGDGRAVAVIPVDSERIAALAVAALALSRARQGTRVVLADLCPGAPAARLAGADRPGVYEVTTDGAALTVAVPAEGDVEPAGPLRSLPDEPTPADELLAGAWAGADLLVTLAPLDPALGGEYISTWAPSVVPVIIAGQSQASRIHATGEMIRLSRLAPTPAVLLGADGKDESLGELPPAPARPLALARQVREPTAG
jgi:capsular polysaccharide biosynthesis protein